MWEHPWLLQVFDKVGQEEAIARSRCKATEDTCAQNPQKWNWQAQYQSQTHGGQLWKALIQIPINWLPRVRWRAQCKGLHQVQEYHLKQHKQWRCILLSRRQTVRYGLSRVLWSCWLAKRDSRTRTSVQDKPIQWEPAQSGPCFDGGSIPSVAWLFASRGQREPYEGRADEANEIEAGVTA